MLSKKDAGMAQGGTDGTGRMMSEADHKDSCEPSLCCDCSSRAELLEELRASVEHARDGAHPPWLTKGEAVREAERSLSEYEASLSSSARRVALARTTRRRHSAPSRCATRGTERHTIRR